MKRLTRTPARVSRAIASATRRSPGLQREAAFGGDLPTPLRHKRGLERARAAREAHDVGMRAELEIHERADRALQRAHVRVLDVAPVLAQVRRDAVGAAAFARLRRARGIGFVGLARLAQRRDVINVDVEPHAPLPSDHFVNRKVVPVMRRLAVLVVLGSLGCGSRPQSRRRRRNPSTRRWSSSWPP